MTKVFFKTRKGIWDMKPSRKGIQCPVQFSNNILCASFYQVNFVLGFLSFCWQHRPLFTWFSPVAVSVPMVCTHKLQTNLQSSGGLNSNAHTTDWKPSLCRTQKQSFLAVTCSDTNVISFLNHTGFICFCCEHSILINIKLLSENNSTFQNVTFAC